MSEAFLRGFAEELDKLAEEKKKKGMPWTEKAALGLLVGIPAGAGAYHGLKGPATRLMRKLRTKKIKHVDFRKLRKQLRDLPTKEPRRKK